MWEKFANIYIFSLSWVNSINPNKFLCQKFSLELIPDQNQCQFPFDKISNRPRNNRRTFAPALPFLTLVRAHYHTNCEQSSQAAIYRAARCIGDKTSARPNRLCPCERFSPSLSLSLCLSLSFSHSGNGNPSLREADIERIQCSTAETLRPNGRKFELCVACSLDRRRGRNRWELNGQMVDLYLIDRRWSRGWIGIESSVSLGRDLILFNLWMSLNERMFGKIFKGKIL